VLKRPAQVRILHEAEVFQFSEFENQTSRQLEGLLVIRSLKVQLEG
jgi:hypothetical protein